MGWKAIQWAAEQTTGSPMAKLVLLALAKYANDEGWCNPSLTSLEKRTEAARSTVTKALRDLESAALIRRDRRRRRSGADTSTDYYLALSVGHSGESESRTRGSESRTRGSAGDGPPRCGRRTPPVRETDPTGVRETDPNANQQVNRSGESAADAREARPQPHHAQEADAAVQAIIPPSYPKAVRRSLSERTARLLTEGIPGDVITAALFKWRSRRDAGPGLLDHLVADVIRERETAAAPSRSTTDERIEAIQKLKAEMCGGPVTSPAALFALPGGAA